MVRTMEEEQMISHLSVCCSTDLPGHHHQHKWQVHTGRDISHSDQGIEETPCEYLLFLYCIWSLIIA